MRPVIYVFINKSLGMSAGKLSSQTAHAVALSLCDEDKPFLEIWRNSIHRTMIILQAKDDQMMKNIEAYLAERNFEMYLQYDEGVNEVEPHSLTAMASKILNKNEQVVEDAFSTFKLYKDVVKITTEFER